MSESLIELSSPQVGFYFPPGHTEPLKSSLTLTNKTNEPVNYKIKTTNNKLFMITPHMGTLGPKQSQTLSIKMSPVDLTYQNYILLHDKFMLIVNNDHTTKIKLYVYSQANRNSIIEAANQKQLTPEQAVEKYVEIENQIKSVKKERDQMYFQVNSISSQKNTTGGKSTYIAALLMIIIYFLLRYNTKIQNIQSEKQVLNISNDDQTLKQQINTIQIQEQQNIKKKTQKKKAKPKNKK